MGAEGRESTLETLRSRGRCEMGVIVTVLAIAAVSCMMADGELEMWANLVRGSCPILGIVLAGLRRIREEHRSVNATTVDRQVMAIGFNLAVETGCKQSL